MLVEKAPVNISGNRVMTSIWSMKRYYLAAFDWRRSYITSRLVRCCNARLVIWSLRIAFIVVIVADRHLIRTCGTKPVTTD